MMYRCEYSSPLGRMILAAEESALVGVWFADQKHICCPESVDLDSELLCRTRHWLDRYFRGERPDPDELPLKLQGTQFQQAVWQCLRSIHYGERVTYGDISEMLRSKGLPSCAQAVGAAVGRNPISIVVPCHRVMGRGGKLTGYDGGVEKKEFLLKLEQR